MKIGMVGLGKLGLPCAVSIAYKGHQVKGFDLDESRMTHEPQPYQEAGPFGTGDFNDFLGQDFSRENLSFGSLQEVADFGDIIFVSVQTPHDPRYEGVTRIPDNRMDFNYDFLENAIKMLAVALEDKQTPTLVAIISTCLPGTVRSRILPHLEGLDAVSVAYNPFFIAMGTTMRDFLHPEFVLLGGEDRAAMAKMEKFYASIHSAPVARMSIESAELSKVSYNTYISFKIAFANTVMEICEGFDKADCDEVIDALSLADRRVISAAYLRGGMGDGGGCHPRDNIAMSWLARDIGLSFDLFDAEMKCREKQAEWLADILIHYGRDTGLPIIILGYAFKPETNLTVGSPAILVKNIVEEKSGRTVLMMDDSVDKGSERVIPGVYLIGCRHDRYESFTFQEGSVVIDPHRYIYQQEGVKVISLGRRK